MKKRANNISLEIIKSHMINDMPRYTFIKYCLGRGEREWHQVFTIAILRLGVQSHISYKKKEVKKNLQ